MKRGSLFRLSVVVFAINTLTLQALSLRALHPLRRCKTHALGAQDLVRLFASSAIEKDPMTTKHLRLGEIFSKTENYTFRVTKNMRNYEWNQEHVETLFEDLVDAMDRRSSSASTSAYELNQLLTLKEFPSKGYPHLSWQVADGQQRIVTLCLLYCAIRDSVKPEYDELRDEIQQKLVFKKFQHDPLPRVTLRGRHNSALLQLLEGKKVAKKDKNRKDAVQQLIVDNYYLLVEMVKKHIEDGKKGEEFCCTFHNFLDDAVYVYLTIPEDMSVARKLVGVSRRGKDAEPLDEFKAMCIFMGIDEEKEQDNYLARWDKLETHVHRPCLQDTLFIIAQRELGIRLGVNNELDLLEEFWKGYDSSGAVFFDEQLNIGAQKLSDFRNGSINCDNTVKQKLVFLLGVSTAQLAKSIEIAVFSLIHSSNPDYVADGVSVLERIGLLFSTTAPDIKSRYKRVFKICRAIREEKSLAPFDLTDNEKDSVMLSLEEKEWKGNNVRTVLSILGRLEASIVLNESESLIDATKVSLEHVLPQRPRKSSKWLVNWDESVRAKWVNRLGNLCILNGKKNSAAGNHDFADKKKLYNKTVFPLTLKLAEQPEWTPEACEANHERLLRLCKQEFGL